MNSAIFIHSQKSLSFLKEYTNLGFDLITTEETLGSFSFSPTVYINEKDLYTFNSNASSTFSSYEKVLTNSIVDWTELRFLHTNVIHPLQYKNQLDESSLLFNTIKQLESSLLKKYSVDTHKLLIKTLYLSKRFDDAKEYTLQLLKGFGQGDFCLSILMLISTQKKDFKQSLELLNALSTNHHYKEILERILDESNPEVLQRELFIAGKDFASIEVIHYD